MATINVDEVIGIPVVQTVVENEYVYNSSSSTSASDTSSFVTGESGALIRSITATLSRRIQFSDACKSGDNIYLELSDNQVTWLDIGSLCFVNNQSVCRLMIENSTSYGVGFDFISNTQLDVTFGTYANMFGKTTVGGAGQAWSVAAGAGYWRIRRERVVQRAYGSGLVTGATPGLIKAQTPQTALTVTGTNWTTMRAVGIAYEDINGVWRLKFNIQGVLSAGATNFTGAISGTVFKSGFAQTITALGAGTSPFTASASVSGGNGNFDIACTTSSTSIRVSGDVELNAKPSWA